MGYYLLSLKTRIWIIFVLLITLSVGATGWTSYWIAAEVMKRNALQLSQTTLNKSVEVLDEKLKKITISILGLTISEPMKQAMRDVQQGLTTSYYSDLSAFQTPLTQAMVQEPLIDSILILTQIGEFYPLTKRRLSDNKFEHSDLYQRFMNHQGAMWVETHKDTFFSNGSRVLSLVMEGVADFPVQKVYVVVNIQEKALKEAINRNIGDKGEEYFLINRQGGEVISSGLHLFNEYNTNSVLTNKMLASNGGYLEHDVNKETYLVNYSRMSVNPEWTLISMMSKKELLRDMVGIQILTLVITIGSIVVALLLSKYLTGILLEPLSKLQKLMKQVGQNDFSVRFSSKYQDEVTQVGFRFNSMLEETADLIERMKDMEREKLKQEIKSLQAQIDPHFLYNTLNTIYWRSQLNQNEDAQHMILALSKMFQLGLNGGRETTDLDKEISHVSQYLNLQQKCYVQLFQYTMDLEDSHLLKQPVLKILLQPLVENSILHGFKNLKNGGKIHITIWSESGQLCFRVEDNGCGMKVQEIYHSMQSEDGEHKSYALRNVFQRLELYYQGQASIELDSIPYEATVVTIRIPLQNPIQIQGETQYA
jgi:two-component system sensor histidine kinase YesM